MNNFINLVSGPDFWNSLFVSGLYVTVVVGAEVIFGLLLALFFNYNFYGKSVLFVIIMIPVIISQAVVGYMFLIMLSDMFGIVSYILSILNVKISILGERAAALAAMILIDILIWTPYCFLVIYAGLKTVPSAVLEAAKIDGATKYKLFRYVMLPLLLPIITVAVIFRTIDAFKTFDYVYIITGGGPGTATTTLSILIYKYFDSGNIGMSSALSLLVLIMAILLSRLYYSFLVSRRWQTT
ncbi:MAG: sugar ABC transporter permease [Nitrososphaerota archaeon]